MVSKKHLLEEKITRRVLERSCLVSIDKTDSLKNASSSQLSPSMAKSSSCPGIAWAAEPAEPITPKTPMQRFKSAAKSVSIANGIAKYWRKDSKDSDIKSVSPLAAPEIRMQSPEVSPILKRRAASITGLKVMCAKEKEPCRLKPKKRMSFSDEPIETMGDYTPYGKKYGAHPNDFEFSKDGRMELVSSRPDEKSILQVKVGDTIECILDAGVQYRTKPQLGQHTKPEQQIELGEEVVVIARSGPWVQDSIGWLPLLYTSEKAAFKVVPPTGKRQYASCRVGVMTRQESKTSQAST
jgi:hypothetical protein